jgi:transcriptional regulator with XRE-family HTH domain
VDFYNNYVRLCNSVGKTPSAVAVEIGIEKSTVSRWSKGSSPNHATKLKVADYFGCSISDLTGEMEQKEKPAQESGLSVDEIKEAFRGKSFEELTEILAALTDELKNTK